MGASTLNTDPSSQAGQGQYTLNSKVMVAAMLILCIVVLFVLTLHVYAKWFWRQGGGMPLPLSNAPNASWRHRRRRSSLPTALTRADPVLAPTICVGLDPSIISSLPTFIYQASYKHHDDAKQPLLECAVCLSEFQSYEKGRILPDCKHSFHIGCIDMWFRSHSTCPLCRAAVSPWAPQHHAQNPWIWSESTSQSAFLALPSFDQQQIEEIASLPMLQTTSTANDQCPHVQSTVITPLPCGKLGFKMQGQHDEGTVKDDEPLQQRYNNMHLQGVPPSLQCCIDSLNGSSSTIAMSVENEGPATSIARCQSLGIRRCHSEDLEASACLRPIKSQSFRMSVRWLLSRDLSRGKGRIFPSLAGDRGAELGQDHQVEQSSIRSSLPLR